jgi:hypothetical protein
VTMRCINTLGGGKRETTPKIMTGTVRYGTGTNINCVRYFIINFFTAKKFVSFLNHSRCLVIPVPYVFLPLIVNY